MERRIGVGGGAGVVMGSSIEKTCRKISGICLELDKVSADKANQRLTTNQSQ
ncbi:hypothetical protein [Nitrosomonas aestuarii]|uniref:hypothetical protein n=1 Tax=Nitrosomonas aestuarii TaxID=52441 RepID=UPI00147F09A9|nr:hypothetical protein [Nitrosomonas aestuarii]